MEMKTLVPILLDLVEDLEEFNGPLQEDFGFGLYPQDIYEENKERRIKNKRKPIRFFCNTFPKRKLRRKKKFPRKGECVGKDGFQMCINVEQFHPNELTVKTVDNWVVIEGKHEEREDEEGYISRHFIRRYQLPKDYDPKEVVSTLSSDGILTVKAPLPVSKRQKTKERVIEIQQTGPAHLTVKENEKEEEKET